MCCVCLLYVLCVGVCLCVVLCMYVVRFVLAYVCCVFCISVCLCVFCVYVHTSVCVVCLCSSLSRAEGWRRGCPLRGAGGGSWSHLIPVDPLTMQGQRGHTHPTGAVIARRHGDAWRGLGREVGVVRERRLADGVWVCVKGVIVCVVYVCVHVCVCVCAHSVQVNVS